ncbi:MAG TPA: hypothetical protein ENN42_05760 [Thioalkalivibrio sp.]|nr:hypothetical protein [Thioalkalivibrio sp.]
MVTGRGLVAGWLLVACGLALAAAPEDFTYRLSDERVWTREAVLVTVEVAAADRFAVLETEVPDLPGMEAVVLPFARESDRLRIGWALFPQAPGEYRLHLPPVGYRLGGTTEREYRLPPQSLHVRALPAYIPPTLSVGEVRIESRIEPAGLLRPGRLAYWRVRLTGAGLLPESLPAILQQLESTKDIEFLSPASRRQKAPALDGVHGEVVHEIPFKPLRNGMLRLPTLEFQYFDPDTGRLQRVRHQPPATPVVGIGWRIVLVLLLSAVVLVGLVSAGRRLRQAWARRRARRRALVQLRAAVNAEEIIAALRQHAQAEGWGANLTAGGWLRRWCEHHGPDEVLTGYADSTPEQSASRCEHHGPDEVLTGLLEAVLRKRFGRAGAAVSGRELADHLQRGHKSVVPRVPVRRPPAWVPEYFRRDSGR